ncbi:hypothetical protein [Hufsiella ginkgonis]|uniref:Uncharacterized protein n=1 Tax=Hufsiella ginkgonis TaxID=2695274 RepID=A0A7K1XSJ6_9SPHI|nr:hypothetical protein [Hufsiella ginkgonis]MXV13922.1 hypothetical protein [Hufsiella ginkgonis]
MKSYLILVCILCFGRIVSAQEQSPGSPSPSLAVVAKLSDLSSAITISESQRVALISFFTKEEIVVATLSRSETTPQQVGASQEQLTAEFRGLLSKEQLAEYSLKKRGSPYALPKTK